MRYLRVKSWRLFQHYKHRSPPWIKLHNTVLEDPDFASLPDASKFHLVGIWLLASKTENRIPGDGEFIRARINAKEQVDLDLLFSGGFIEWEQGASKALAECLQLAVPEKSRVEQSRVEQRLRRFLKNRNLLSPSVAKRLRPTMTAFLPSGKCTREELTGWKHSRLG